MGYVRSRKFCCCLPVRFGVFCMALLGFAAGGFFGVVGWMQVHRYVAGDLDLSGHEKTALWLVSLAYTWFSLVAIVGLFGACTRKYGAVSFYAYTVTVNTFVIIAVGIYFVWTLWHGRDDKAVDKCTGATDGELHDIKHWICEKGFTVVRVVIVILMVIIWIFQLVGIFIVFDYVGQLKEEYESEDEEARKNPPPIIVQTATPAGPQMRTTYDAAPYDPHANPVQGGWASAKSPYAFTTPETAQVGGR